MGRKTLVEALLGTVWRECGPNVPRASALPQEVTSALPAQIEVARVLFVAMTTLDFGPVRCSARPLHLGDFGSSSREVGFSMDADFWEQVRREFAEGAL